VRTVDGRAFEADQVFLCGGADTATLFPQVMAGSGLRVCKLQMMRTVPLPDVRLPHSILSGHSIRRYPAFASCPSYELLLTEPVQDGRLAAYGICLLIKQEADGSVVIGDSHQYADPADLSAFEERTDGDINGAILEYARSMRRLPSWELQSLWNGYYLVHKNEPIFTATVEGRVHIVTGIGGNGMPTGPGYAQYSVETVLD
jgi:D-hydroxyproline dehydrogenase subunit beta